jgi:nucleoside-diphosphate-sugar epimerase
MQKINVFITGANGEVGHGLIKRLSELKKYQIFALYRNNIDTSLKPFVNKFIKGDVLERSLMEKIVKENKIEIIFHLAAVLSTGGENAPEMAHKINVEGTANLLEIATQESLRRKKAIKFIFPSSIAVYGLPSLSVKNKNPKVKESEFLNPITMYGISKLYCENLGIYYSKHYKLLSELDRKNLIDFRCVRFPGLISATTMPSGGTSDYAPEMLHSLAQGKDYECFVMEDRKIPFMAMPDGVESLLKLLNAPKAKLTKDVYNISGFAASAKEIEKEIKKYFPKGKISYRAHTKRQMIVDSWSADVNDIAAKKDWSWQAKYNFQKAFRDYLIPVISRKYNR